MQGEAAKDKAKAKPRDGGEVWTTKAWAGFLISQRSEAHLRHLQDAPNYYLGSTVGQFMRLACHAEDVHTP